MSSNDQEIREYEQYISQLESTLVEQNRVHTETFNNYLTARKHLEKLKGNERTNEQNQLADKPSPVIEETQKPNPTYEERQPLQEQSINITINNTNNQNDVASQKIGRLRGVLKHEKLKDSQNKKKKIAAIGAGACLIGAVGMALMNGNIDFSNINILGNQLYSPEMISAIEATRDRVMQSLSSIVGMGTVTPDSFAHGEVIYATLAAGFFGKYLYHRIKGKKEENKIEDLEQSDLNMGGDINARTR